MALRSLGTHSAQRQAGAGLTRLANHAPGPGAVVVHFVDAAPNLAAVVGAVRLPVLALGAPDREAVAPARVHVARVKGLEAELGLEGHDAGVADHSGEGAGVARGH